VTARLEDRVGPLRELIERSPHGFALVTTTTGVLLGRLRFSALGDNPDALAGDVMEPGPSTVRADTPAAKLAGRLAEQGLKTAIVTTPEGRLIGVARRADLERAAAATPAGETKPS
jgi:CBS-domain-containing membrane protein